MKPVKMVAEMRLIHRAMMLVPNTYHVLDVPCGDGRVMLDLAQRGYAVTGADVSEEMTDVARRAMVTSGLSCPVHREDLQKLTFPDGSFDTVICFRLFHKLPTELRQLTIGELCRVSRRYVLLSYFSAWSYTSLNRTLCGFLAGSKPDRFATSLKDLKGYFAHCGFELLKDFAQLPLLQALHLGMWKRIAPIPGTGQERVRGTTLRMSRKKMGSRRFAYCDYSESPPPKDVLAVTARRHLACRRTLFGAAAWEPETDFS